MPRIFLHPVDWRKKYVTTYHLDSEPRPAGEPVPIYDPAGGVAFLMRGDTIYDHEGRPRFLVLGDNYLLDNDTKETVFFHHEPLPTSVPGSPPLDGEA
jgi:hypothetical protein